MVAGGTGGHIYPALQLAKTMENDHEIIFFGNESRLESTIIPQAGYNFIPMETIAFNGGLLRRVNSLILLYDAYREMKRQLKLIKPDIVIGFGNYVSLPVVMAAVKLKIKTMIHEQNRLAGSANKFLAKRVDYVVCSHRENLNVFPKGKTSYLGNPRSSAFKGLKPNKEVLKKYDLKSDIPTILICMGSLGSLTVNKFMIDALKELDKCSFQVIYVTGKEYYEEFKAEFTDTEKIKIVAYVDMVEVLPNITVLVSRAGATTIAEITALGVAAVLIPSPYVPNNHQYYNAKDLVDKNAAILVKEEDLEVDKFVDLLDKLIKDSTELKVLANNAKKLGNVKAGEAIIRLIDKAVNDEC